jgi:hypothetical protein
VKFGKIVPNRNKYYTSNDLDLPPKYVAPNPRFGEIGVMPTPQPKLVLKDM